jgi:hypothetical protein
MNTSLFFSLYWAGGMWPQHSTVDMNDDDDGWTWLEWFGLRGCWNIMIGKDLHGTHHCKETSRHWLARNIQGLKDINEYTIINAHSSSHAFIFTNMTYLLLHDCDMPCLSSVPHSSEHSH